MTNQRSILVSGCSSGLGLALVERLAHQNVRVYAGLRNLGDATRLPANVRPLQLDVTRTEQIQSALQTIESECGHLDVLINNAGINAVGPWETVPPEIVRNVFDVNFFGAVELTRAFLPMMRRGQRGQIVMVSSLSGLVGLPADGVYAASKFALEAFAESLSYEVRRWNIKVSIFNPGGYATNLMRKAWRPANADGPYEGLIQGALTRTEGGSGDSRKAAADIVTALDTPQGPLRYPLDDTARMVFDVLKLEPQSDRETLIRNASGLAWWIDGQATDPHGV
ncbi:MAG: SDR family oxidoreductase [Proteobacteria bacterium]|nr:SDR family oxidoreductase [Pseudomonadota bacterium]